MKAWWKSWTLWFNTAMGTLMATADQWAPYLLTQLPALKEMLPGNMYFWVFMFAIAANVALRFKTASAVGMRDA